MVKIIEKEYPFRKLSRNLPLIFGLFFGLCAIFSLIRLGLDRRTVDLVYFIIFLAGSVSGLLGFYSVLKQRIYIQLTQKGMNISSIGFPPRSKTVEWKDIREIETIGRYRMFLALSSGNKTGIQLGALKKSDREDFVRVLKEILESRPAQDEERRSGAKDIGRDESEKAHVEEFEGGPAKGKRYSCPSCGAVITRDDNECIGCGRTINW